MVIKKILLFVTAFTFILSSILFSQEEEKGKVENNDTAETEEVYSWDNDDWDDFEFDLFDSYKSPSVSLTYGFSSINLHNFSGSFANPNIPEIKLGYTTEKPTWNEEGILKYKYNYFFLSNVTTDISGTPEADEIESNLWRFGFGWANGYGYDLGSAAIIPYNSYSLAWSKLDVRNFPANEQDRNKLWTI